MSEQRQRVWIRKLLNDVEPVIIINNNYLSFLIPVILRDVELVIKIKYIVIWFKQSLFTFI